MAFTNNDLNSKIRAFLGKARLDEIVGVPEKDGLLALLSERDQSSSSNVVGTELSRLATRLSTWLGMTKKTTEGGEAGKIDNLLVLINSFVVIFCVAAIVPVLYIYRARTWIIPVLLICPCIHLIARRLSRNPDMPESRVKNMHLFAAMISIIPLMCLASYSIPYVGVFSQKEIFSGVIVALWVSYTVVVSMVIRTESGFYCSLYLVCLAVNAALFGGREDFPGTAMANLLIGAILICLAGRSRAGKNSLSAGRLYATAVFFIGLALVINTVLLLPKKGHSDLAPPLYGAALLLLPIVLKTESARLATDTRKNWCIALLVITWFYFGLTQLIKGTFGIRGLVSDAWWMEVLIQASLYCSLCIVCAWSLWFLHEQFVALKDFDVDIFSFAAMVLIGCLAIGYYVLNVKIGHVAGLGMAIAVYLTVAKMRKQHESPPEKTGAENSVGGEVSDTVINGEQHARREDDS